MTAPAVDVSPNRLLDDIFGFRRAAALRTAIELQLFGRIAGGARQLGALAAQTGASQRGLAALLDFLVTEDWLTKADGAYGLTPESAAFLVPGTPAYLGDVTGFLATAHFRAAFDALTEAVRDGRPPMGEAMLASEHASWTDFARSMAALQMLPAMLTAGFATKHGQAPKRVLDVAAGHGLFGLKLAEAVPSAHVTALDWPGVLAVARENAQRMGLGDRFTERPGDAHTVAWGEDYDLILLPNFLHHFGNDECLGFLKKAHDALAPGGRVLVVEFAPNDDRVSPPFPAKFALVMVATNPKGTAYTRTELETMLGDASFAVEAVEALEPTPSTAFLARKN